MIRNATINGKNIWTTWGAELTDDATDALLAPPPVKDYIENNSRLEDRTRKVIPATGMKFDTREVSLSILITGASRSDYLAKYMSFVEELKKGKLAIRIEEIGKEYVLYYRSCKKYGSYGCSKGKFVLKLEE